MRGLKCYACRRFVLRRVHFIILILAALAFVLLLLEIVARLTPPPLK